MLKIREFLDVDKNTSTFYYCITIENRNLHYFLKFDKDSTRY